LATRTQKIKVGVFLLLNIAVAVGVLMLVAGMRRGNFETYDVIFGGSVLGLSEGGPVLFQGVPVGKVEMIRVAEDQLAHAKVKVNQDKAVLYKGVQAKLEIYSLAVGTMCVAFYGGDKAQGPHNPAEPILAESSLVESFSAQFATIVDDLVVIVADLKDSLAGLEEGQLTDIIRNVAKTADEAQAFVAEARTALGRIDGTLADIQGGVAGFNDSVAQIGDFAREATALVGNANETLALVHQKIEPVDAAAFLDTLSGEARALSQSIREATVSLEGSMARVTQQTDNVQYNLVETLEGLNEAVVAVRDLAEYLRANPSSLVRGTAPAKE
jgi:phospholipid/cholesterol/gamma-HCH transport system substrate-binding protein